VVPLPQRHKKGFLLHSDTTRMSANVLFQNPPPLRKFQFRLMHSFKNFCPLETVFLATSLFRGTFYDFSPYRVRRIELGISNNVLPARIGRHYLIEKNPCTVKGRI